MLPSRASPRPGALSRERSHGPDAQVSARAVPLLGLAHALLEPRLERLGALVCFISYSAG